MGAPIRRAALVLHLDSVRSFEFDDDGFLGIQVDDDGEQGANPSLEAQVEHFETLHPHGFYGCPQAPDVDGSGRANRAPTVLTLWEGSRAYTFALHDCRVVPGLALLKPGEAVWYGPASNFGRMHADGRISLMCTTDGTDQGELIASEQGPNGYAWRGPWGKLTHDGLGLHYLHAGGARLDLGAISGLPLPGLGSYAKLSAATVQIESSALSLGTGTLDPAAKATPTVGALSSIATALTAAANAMTAQAVALTSLGALPTSGPASAQCAAAAAAATTAAAALSAAVTSVGAATPLLPAVSVTVA